MKLDVYTKGVLTVIAVCLVILTLNQVSVIPTVQAAVGPSQMEQDNQIRPNLDGSINVRIIGVNTNIPVEVKNSYVPVEVKKLPGTIPVEVKNSYVPVEVKNNYVPVEVKNSYINTKSY